MLFYIIKWNHLHLTVIIFYALNAFFLFSFTNDILNAGL